MNGSFILFMIQYNFLLVHRRTIRSTCIDSNGNKERASERVTESERERGIKNHQLTAMMHFIPRFRIAGICPVKLPRTIHSVYSASISRSIGMCVWNMFGRHITMDMKTICSQSQIEIIKICTGSLFFKAFLISFSFFFIYA